MRNFIVSAAILSSALASAVSAQSVWTPEFKLLTSTERVTVGQTFTVLVEVSGVKTDPAGYQFEIAFDPAVIKPVSLVQGPYIKFNTYFGSVTAFKNFVRIGALNFPVNGKLNPTEKKGTGSGVITTATFKCIGTPKNGEPLVLDNRGSLCVGLVNQKSLSFKGITNDIAVQVTKPGDILSISGQPNPGGTVRFTTISPTHAGLRVITVVGFTNTVGIPLAPGVTVPVDYNFLVPFCLNNGGGVFANTYSNLDATGKNVATLQTPVISTIVGLSLPVGCVIRNSATGTWLKASKPRSFTYFLR